MYIDVIRTEKFCLVQTSFQLTLKNQSFTVKLSYL